MVIHPRDEKRAAEGKDKCTGYVHQAVSTVRADAERQSGRKVGVVGESSQRVARRTAINKNLRRKGPVMRPPRRPILVHHLPKVVSSKLFTGDSMVAKVNKTALALG